VLTPREHDFEYHAEHIGQRWVIRTNWNAKNFRVMQVDDARVGDKKGWNEFVPARKDALIDRSTRSGIFSRSRSTATACSACASSLERRQRNVRQARRCRLHRGIGENREQDTDTLRYTYTSLITPNTVYDLDMTTGKRELKKRDPVLGGYDPRELRCRADLGQARDGTWVPVSLAYRKDFKRDGTAPLYQYGYGFLWRIGPIRAFRRPRFSLIDRGSSMRSRTCAAARRWARLVRDGKLLKKKNTFTDFIDVTEYLVKYGYAAKDKVVAEGGSAGGLLMGAITNMAPQDYRRDRGARAVRRCRHDDARREHSADRRTNSTSGATRRKPSTTTTWLSYSPYDNVSAQAYPALLVTTGLWDSQVQYYEPAKWVAKLRRQDRQERAAAQGQHGCRPWRQVRALPALPRGCEEFRVHASIRWGRTEDVSQAQRTEEVRMCETRALQQRPGS
jgi:oligopeptidase B